MWRACSHILILRRAIAITFCCRICFAIIWLTNHAGDRNIIRTGRPSAFAPASATNLAMEIEIAPDAVVAKALGLTLNELAQLEWDMSEETSADGGIVYSYVITFAPDSRLELLDKIRGLDGFSVRLSPNVFDEPDEEQS